jgi:hypothetical protein
MGVGLVLDVCSVMIGPNMEVFNETETDVIAMFFVFPVSNYM